MIFVLSLGFLKKKKKKKKKKKNIQERTKLIILMMQSTHYIYRLNRLDIQFQRKTWCYNHGRPQKKMRGVGGGGEAMLSWIRRVKCEEIFLLRLL